MKIHLLILILFLFSLASCQQPSNKEKPSFQPPDTLEYQHYGMPSPRDEYLERAGMELFGFKYLSVAGCEVTDSLVDAVEENNEYTFRKLDEKFGKDWPERWGILADSLYRLDYPEE